MTQKQSLETSVARVEELELVVAQLNEKVANLDVVIEAQHAAKVELSNKISKLESSNETLGNQHTQLAASNAALTEKNETLTGEAKTAEIRAREINARMQINVPNKPAQGDDGLLPQTTALKGRARLTAAIEAEFATK